MRSPPSLGRRAVLAMTGALPLLLAAQTAARAGALPLVTVTKDPSCGCCGAWADHLRGAGYPVRIVETDDLDAVKARLGVPADLASCHTAEVGGYVVEGHVPAAALARLLAERPEATGLAVPGMPAGSPGMEVPGLAPEAYDVILFGPSGQRTFARFLGARAA